MTESTLYDSQTTRNLRNLYFTRTAVQLLWAGSVLATAAANPHLAAALLVLYPLWDVACTVYDLNSSRSAASSSSRSAQYANIVFGVATAIGIALTAFSRVGYAVAIFGAWALAAGVLQLVLGLIRRKKMGGQWAMILSGLQSSAAGMAFILGGLGGKLHIKDLGGYAVFGGVYFLIAGILLHRKLSLVRTTSGVAL
jgi:uncharacterized membrane protein HdeD (DUF308 family)